MGAPRDMPADGLLTYRGTVYPWHCDHMGHMNVMWYAGKFDEATWQLFSALGLTPGFLRAHHRGMAAVEQHTTYHAELHAGDVISITSRMLEVADKVVHFAHEMRREDSGMLAATTALTGVYIDTQTRKACPLPADVKAKAAALGARAASTRRPAG